MISFENRQRCANFFYTYQFVPTAIIFYIIMLPPLIHLDRLFYILYLHFFFFLLIILIIFQVDFLAELFYIYLFIFVFTIYLHSYSLWKLSNFGVLNLSALSVK